MGTLIEFFSKLFDTSDFPARWYCGKWTSGHGWLHIISDLAIWGAYMAIPVVLVTFAFRHRKEIPYSNIYLLFAGFILACGTTHLIEAIIFWHPVYRLSGISKLVTASISWATVIVLIRMAPQAMELPGLKRSNTKLEREIKRRREAEKDLVETEKLFRITFENAAVGMAHVAPDGTWLRVNNRLSEIVGYTPEDLLQLTFQDITHPEDLNADLESYSKLLAGEIEKYAMEKRYYHKEGNIVWILLTVSLVKHENGEPDYTIAIIQDITERKTLEEASAETQRLLSTFMENAPSAMGVVELAPDNSDILHLLDNPAGERFFNVTEGGTSGKWSIEHLNMWPAAVQEWIENYRKAQRNQSTVNFQFQFIPPDSPVDSEQTLPLDNQIWLNVNMAYLGTGEEGRDRFCYIASDDTFRKQSEFRLQRSHDTFFHLIEAAPFGIHIVDDQLRMSQCSSGTEKLFGSADLLVGLSMDQIFTRLWGKQISSELMAVFQQTLTSGKSYTASDYSLYNLDNGKLEYFDWEIQQIILPDGKYGVVCYFYETTQWKEAELAARESESRLKLATELVKVGVVVCECENKHVILDKIAAEQYGLPSESALTLEEYRNCFFPEDRDRFDDQMHHAIAPGNQSTPTLEYRVVQKNGSRRWLGICMQVEFEISSTGSPEPSHWLIASIDLTERKRHEEQLDLARQQAEAANRARGEFLANMSHEIRTPMAALMGHVEILMTHLQDPDNRESVRTIKRNGHHLLEILNDILDISRIEAGKLEVEQTRCDIVQLLKDIDSLMRVRVDAHRVNFIITATEKIPKFVQTDPKRLKQILLNLVGNAIKFTHIGQIKVEVIFNSDESQIEFHVEDTGIGIPQEILSTLFRPFSQGDASRTRKYGGSGLGLAISQRLAGLLDGSITVESQTGVGSTFVVSLPILDKEELDLITLELDLPTAEEEQTVIRHLEGNILLVDDRRDIRFVGQHFLEEAGATVTTASDGAEAIRLVENAAEMGNEFRLIIMDVQMPKMDGNTAVMKLREMGFQTPIISLTADAMREDRERCLASGADDYLAKPIDKAHLVNKAASLICDITPEELKERRDNRAADTTEEGEA
ncbi:Autoinducer 2 sensor kinase/phosphatase LuxQ [Polystyrenella longa]|uniref:histidine kinase n=1 Tax=Polystyrenella longa TaxID=2528007 RepID=A0A518CT35_9PLAN|nr:PAS domain S-box protein [Polystyrenella longa]QDU82389.1 Autoinducer 2 sensor kinase/phosphatase LuxQ [Polystyrenella longa]